MSNVLFVVLLVLLMSVFGSSESAATINGVVTRDSKPLRNAFVLVHDYLKTSPYVSQDWKLRTGEDGSFQVLVPAGCYHIFISAFMELPSSQRFCVSGGDKKRLQIKLQRDPTPHGLLE